MKTKFATIATLILLSVYPIYAFTCAHCIPMNEPTDDPCSIAGWCGNGNIRAYEIRRNQYGELIYTECVQYTGIVCGAY